MSMLPIPSRFHDFEVLEFVADGLSGKVYKARYLKNNSIVALKIFSMNHNQTILGYCTNEQMLLREVTRHRQHPHIAGYVTSDMTRSPYYLATYYIEGAHSLEIMLGRSLEPGFVVRVIEQIGSALDYLHYGHPELSPIIHRDVKPHNILIDAAGNAGLIDLSIASHKKYVPPEEHGLGTPQYMASEQHEGDEVPATDQFALAVVTLQMLVGRTLLPKSAPAAFKHLDWLRNTGFAEVRRWLQKLPETANVIIQALQFDPTQRHANCEEFAYRLRQALIADGQSFVDGGQPAPAALSRNSVGFIVICSIVAVAIMMLILALKA